jgi:hypothetical protein
VGAAIVIMAAAISVVVLFERSRERSVRWPLPSSPETHRLIGCGCPLPEGGILDVEGELKQAGAQRRSYAWRLTDGKLPVPFGDNEKDPFRRTALPGSVAGDDGFDLLVGCDGPRIVVAAFDRVSAFEMPAGRHLWSKELPRPVPRGMEILFSKPAIACSTLNVQGGVAEVPSGQATLRLRTDTGELAPR